MKTALIGSIGRYAIHDGPGIRTTVFFKGCSLHCPWCHNPEFISARPEIVFNSSRCLGCGECIGVCPESALSPGRPVGLDFKRCTGCGLCAAECPSKTLEVAGQSYTLDDLVEVLLRDRCYYETSKGGVTLTGGEPTLQLEFAGLLLRRLLSEGIHTAIETNGAFAWKDFEKELLPGLDLVLFDLKIADPVSHQRITGVDNEPILANLARLVQLRPDDVVVRIPLIPGYTATKENVAALAAILREMKVRRCSLLRYHPFGISKAEKVGGKVDSSLPSRPMSPHESAHWREYFQWTELVEY
jgi:pyruvate formate lyase activating enzyme